MNFISKNYYFIGTVCGIFLIALFGQAVASDFFWQIIFKNDEKFLGTPPVFIGMFSALIIAMFCDKRNKKYSFFISSLLIPSVIFLSGLFLGCLSNFGINGGFSNFDSWFVRPFLGIGYLGVPLSFVVGTAYFSFFRLLEKHCSQ